MADLSGDLFITWHHIHKLTGKSESTCRLHLRDIRKRFGVVKPQRVTRDMACIYYIISLEQYIYQMKLPD